MLSFALLLPTLLEKFTTLYYYPLCSQPRRDSALFSVPESFVSSLRGLSAIWALCRACKWRPDHCTSRDLVGEVVTSLPRGMSTLLKFKPLTIAELENLPPRALAVYLSVAVLSSALLVIP